jgi:chromosome segregation ATPase
MEFKKLITKEVILECMSAVKRIKKSGYEFLLEKENNLMLVYKDDMIIDRVNVEFPDLAAEAKIKAEEETREKEIAELKEAKERIFVLEHEAYTKDEEIKKTENARREIVKEYNAREDEIIDIGKEIIVLERKLKKADKTLDETLIIIKEKNEEIKKLKTEAKQKK